MCYISPIMRFMTNNTPTYSIIFPVHNEKAVLAEILQRTISVLEGLRASYEIICVDDYSTDGSWEIIEELHHKNSHIKGIKFSRNFGHQSAIYAGIKHCTGDYIAVLDADGQDPPELLPEFFAKCREGYDVVYAIRKKRKENILKKMAYKMFYIFYRAIVPFNAPLDSGDFSVFTKKVAVFIQSLNERNPFIRGLRSWHGGKQCGIEYERQSRLAGKTKYSFYKLLHLALNASITFSKVPLRFISLSGIVISLISFLFGGKLIVQKMIGGINLPGWTSIATLIIFFGGINLFVLGIIGEYIGHIFDEVKGRPSFLVDETIGFSQLAWDTQKITSK